MITLSEYCGLYSDNKVSDADGWQVCVYRLSVVSQLEGRAACCNSVWGMCPRQLENTSVCVVTRVYVSNKLNNCGYLGFCGWYKCLYFIYVYQRECVCIVQIFLFVSRKKLKLVLKEFLCLKHTNFMWHTQTAAPVIFSVNTHTCDMESRGGAGGYIPCLSDLLSTVTMFFMFAHPSDTWLLLS